MKLVYSFLDISSWAWICPHPQPRFNRNSFTGYKLVQTSQLFLVHTNVTVIINQPSVNPVVCLSLCLLTVSMTIIVCWIFTKPSTDNTWVGLQVFGVY